MKKAIFSIFSRKWIGAATGSLLFLFLALGVNAQSGALTTGTPNIVKPGQPASSTPATFVSLLDARTIIWSEIQEMESILPGLPNGSQAYIALNKRLTLFKAVYGNIGHGYTVSGCIARAFGEIYGSVPVSQGLSTGFHTAIVLTSTASGGTVESAALYNDIVSLLLI